jgi:hypothetical protein
MDPLHKYPLKVILDSALPAEDGYQGLMKMFQNAALHIAIDPPMNVDKALVNYLETLRLPPGSIELEVMLIIFKGKTDNNKCRTFASLYHHYFGDLPWYRAKILYGVQDKIDEGFKAREELNKRGT